MSRKKTALCKPPSRRPDRGTPVFTPRRRRGPNDPYSIAVHEAGHAVAAVALGLPLKSVDVRVRRLPGGRVSVGYTNCPIPATREPAVLSAAMTQLMCGPLAEARVDPAAARSGCHDLDQESARRLAAFIACESTTDPDGRDSISSREIQREAARIEQLVGRANAQAGELVRSHWAAIRETAGLLAQREFLRAEQVAAIVASHSEAEARAGSAADRAVDAPAEPESSASPPRGG